MRGFIERLNFLQRLGHGGRGKDDELDGLFLRRISGLRRRFGGGFGRRLRFGSRRVSLRPGCGRCFLRRFGGRLCGRAGGKCKQQTQHKEHNKQLFHGNAPLNSLFFTENHV